MPFSPFLRYDFFSKFNFNKNGLLSASELWSGFTYLHIELTALDVLDFVHSGDVDRDGNLSYKELIDTLQDPDKHGEDDEGCKNFINSLLVIEAMLLINYY